MTAFNAVPANPILNLGIGPCTSSDMKTLLPDNGTLTARECTVASSNDTGGTNVARSYQGGDHGLLVNECVGTECPGRRQARCQPGSDLRRSADCADRKGRQAGAQAPLRSPPREGLSLCVAADERRSGCGGRGQ